MEKLKKNLPTYVLFLVILLAIFLRFYNTPLRYSFDEDSGRDALIAIEGAKELQLPLTGPFSSLGPFTFGPWYYYQLIIFSLLTPFTYASWIYLGLASVLFVFVMYKIGKNLEGKYFGILAAFFAAISPPQISSAIGLSNANLISIYAAFSILIFIKLIKKKLSYWWSFLLGIVLGIGINHHYQMVGLTILPIILLIIKPKKYLYFVTALTGIFITFIPLLIFDANNHWYTLKNMFYYYTQGSKAIYIPNRWLFYLRDFWPPFWSFILGVPNFIGIIIIISSSITMGWLIFKKKISHPMVLLILAFGFNFVLLRYYWGERNFGYLQFLHPFIFLFTGLFVWQIFKFKFGKYIGSIILLILFLLILPKSFDQFTLNSLHIEAYREAKIIMDSYPNQKITLYNCKNLYKMRAQAVSFVLNANNKLSDTGKKIAFLNTRCLLPKNKSAKDNELGKFYPHDNLIVDLSSATDDALAKAGWGQITPKVIFDSTIRWWFSEKP